MTKSPMHELSDGTVQCLACACRTDTNHTARELLRLTCARTPRGVLAAAFLAEEPERNHILWMGRVAIAEQRRECAANGRPKHCWLGSRPRVTAATPRFP